MKLVTGRKSKTHMLRACLASAAATAMAKFDGGSTDLGAILTDDFVAGFLMMLVVDRFRAAFFFVGAGRDAPAVSIDSAADSELAEGLDGSIFARARLVSSPVRRLLELWGGEQVLCSDAENGALVATSPIELEMRFSGCQIPIGRAAPSETLERSALVEAWSHPSQPVLDSAHRTVEASSSRLRI